MIPWHPSFIESLGWAVLHSLWQGFVAAGLLFAVRRAVRSPLVRYSAGLVAMTSVPVVFVFTVITHLPSSFQSTIPLPPAVIDAATATSASFGPTTGSPFTATYIEYVAVLWLLGACVCQAWQIIGLLSVARLRREGICGTPSHEWQQALSNHVGLLGIRRPVRLLESMLVDTPAVIGHFRPVIVMPAGLLTGLPATQMEAILLHELAHIRRCDYAVNLVQRWLESIFFYHPAFWWISRVIRDERENCCDDVAVALTGKPHNHALALAALEGRRAQNPAPALAASGGSLHRRIQRLLQPTHPTGASALLSAIGIMVVVSAVALAGWQASGPQKPAAPQPASAYEKWLNEDVVYIIAPEERAAFERLRTDEERQQFIEQFWRRRDPDASTVANEAKDEHYRRIAYANERFASAKPGWRTDRGRIYIQWGPPAEIESHPSGRGNMPPYEMWRYRAVEGVRPATDVTFVDPRRDGEYQLANPSAGDPRAAGFNRMLRWTVTDPMNRFVTGLAPEQFDVRENGFTRTITYFAGPGTPTVIAVVSAAGVSSLNASAARVIQTRTVQDAVQRLLASTGKRKVLLLADISQPAISAPAGIEVLRPASTDIAASIIEIANQYVAGVILTAPYAPVEIALKTPRGLPELKLNR